MSVTKEEHRRETGRSLSIGREKCVTGVEGLDNVLGGGIPRNNTVLLTGN